VFESPETQEFRGQPADALRQYERLAKSDAPEIRAGALLRIARVHRAARKWDASLRAYRQLASIEGVLIDGAPADLQARRALGDVLHDAGRAQELEASASALGADLLAGRWAETVDRATWQVAAADVERWTGQPLEIPADRALISAVADVLHREWTERQSDGLGRSEWRLADADGTRLTLLVSRSSAQALVVAPSHLARWLEDAAAAAGPAADVRIAAASAAGALGGAPALSHASIVRVPAGDSGLPWTLAVSTGDSSAAAELASRRWVYATGMAAILVLLGGSSYILWRAMSRELAVARLQTEFVSAVSHEFRTPLTSIRHVTELLNEDQETPPEERRAFYAALARNTERLQRFVESLLDFSRLEAGRRPYALRPTDAIELTRDVVAEFAREAEGRGARVALEVAADPMPVLADAPAFTNALWNLLDNAVKYSSPPCTIAVTVRRLDDGVAIAVRDRGIGIPASEQKDIFHRFVRGRAASRLGIGGTGLGLAIVSHIVSAHAGRIEVESAEGDGSTFTIRLPAHGPSAGSDMAHQAEPEPRAL
jgi:signal transduction histidine kinase